MFKTFCLTFLFSFCTFAQNKPQTLNVIQTQISSCGLSFPELNKILNYNQLYAAVDKKYLLYSEKTIERELRYRSKGENYRLKINNDVLTLYRVGEEDRMIKTSIETPKPIDAKQKITTVKGKVRQLTLNAKIDEDWGQYFEQRENGVQIEYSIRNSKISQMKIDLTKTKQVLDCKVKGDSEVCFCLK
ncbi:hypothetical protein CIK05_04935 [Bdellovibrio sp. qaytius]|nr:hypothetical protein CIK05_04935 [Bdellovibrio sp. qaytius]